MSLNPVWASRTQISCCEIASLLRESLKDDAILARLSDDVFGTIIPNESSSQALTNAEALCKKISENLFEARGKTIQLTVSIGISVINDNAPSAQDILGRAHSASDSVKSLEGHKNGNGVAVYTPKSDIGLSGNERGQAIIQEALDNNSFKLLFQPIISLRGESDEHYEAFIRMIDDKGKEVSPYDFLPPGGPSKMASKIDRWVILQTIKHLSEHRSKGHETKLFLNLTAETIQDKTFTSWLNVALTAARLPGDSLIFQISEASAVTYLKQAKEFARELVQLRCKISINHFGCALNPFNLLTHVESDYIKLDGSFTQDMQKDEESKERAKEMISTLQNQGKLTIVPLVESAALLSVLWQAGVNYIQGYYLQAPTSEMSYDFSEDN
jgi:EAL domain-containing protein (putative c-di-GMP-specific phosphodiesterase class I)